MPAVFLGCIEGSVASRQVERGAAAALLCSDETSPGVTCPTLVTSAREGHRPVGVGPEEVHRIFRKIEHLLYEERLRELESFSLEKTLWRPYCFLSMLKGEL